MHGLVNTGVFLTDAWTSGADRMQDLDHSVSQDQKGQQVQQVEDSIAQDECTLSSCHMP